MSCKHCGSFNYVKNGIQRIKQRYKCGGCRKNFTNGDDRRKDRTAEKAACLLLYTTGQASMRYLAGLFNVSVRTIHEWIKSFDDASGQLGSNAETSQMEVGKVWGYISKILQSQDASSSLTVSSGELSNGLKLIMILQPSGTIPAT